MEHVKAGHAIVRISGREYDVESFSTSGSIGSHSVGWLPVAGGRLSASTGSLRLRGVDCSPWCPTPIVQGETVTIDISLDGGAPVRVFTGVTDRVSGSASDDVVSVDVVDRIDRFDKAISLPAMLRHWPSLSWGVPVDRHMNLNALYVLDRAVRNAGFFATPPLSGDVLLAATCMGSVFPTWGAVYSAVAAVPGAGFSGQAVAFRRSSWGYALGNGTVLWNPSLSAGDGKLTRTLQQTFLLHHDDDKPKTWISNFTLIWGDNVGLRVRVYTGGNIDAAVNSGSGYTVVAQLFRSQYGDAEAFTVRWDPVAGQVTIAARGGVSVSGAFTPPQVAVDTPMTRVRAFCHQNGYAMGGLQVAYSTANHHNFVRSAVYSPPATEFVQWPALEAFPDLPDKQVRSIIEEYAEATLAGIWLDEDGVFRHRDRVTMASAAPSKVLTSLDDLMSLGWSHQTKSLHSSVVVEGQSPTVTRRRYPSLLLYQGAKETFDEDESKVDFIEPPVEENWFMVETPKRAQDMTVRQIRRGQGSVMGGVVIDDDDQESQAWSGNLAQSWAQLKHQKWLLESTAAVGADGRVEMRLVEAGGYGQYSAEALPIIRGRAKTVWEDISVTGAHTGPAHAPQHVHSTGPWIQQEPELQGIADWLSEVLTNPEPVLDDVQIVPDPTIRRGDVVWLEDSTRYKIRLKVMVMGTNIGMSAGPPLSLTMSISCRVLSAVNLTDNTGTWDDAGIPWGDAHYMWDEWPAPSFPPPLPEPPEPTYLEWDQALTAWDETDTTWKEN